MSGRTQVVLGRFPAHLEAARPGKQLERVVGALVAPLDLLSAEMASVRRAHRLAHADTVADVLRIGAIHGIGAADLALLFRRAARTRELAAALDAAATGGDADARDEAVSSLLALWGVPGGAEALSLFAAPGASPDPAEAARRMARAFRAATDYRATVEGARRRVGWISRLHAAGNGTVRAVLEAGASALDLELDTDRNAAAKAAVRPVVTVTPGGAAGRTAWSYVVVARSLTRCDPAISAAAGTLRGAATLSETDFNLLRWEPVPDAVDYLVFRVAAGGTPAGTGLVTPEPLAADAAEFRDTGIEAGVPLPPQQADDGIFHSRDLFWHSTFVRDRARPVRRVDPEPPAQAVAVDGDISLDDLAGAIGAQPDALIARMEELEATADAVDATLSAATAREAAIRLGGGGIGEAETAAQLAARLSDPGRPVTRRDVYRALIALDAAGIAVGIRFEAATPPEPPEADTLTELLFTLDEREGTPDAVDATLDVPTARAAAIRLGGRGSGGEETAGGLAARLNVPARLVTRADVYATLADILGGGVAVEVSFRRVAAEVLAADRGFAVVEPRRVPVFEGMTATDLARRAGVPPAAVAALLDAGADLLAPLEVDEAKRIAGELGKEPFDEQLLRIGQTVTVAELAGRMGARVRDALRQLRVLGVEDPQAETRLDGAAAARLARWRGYGVEQPLPDVPELLGIEENPLRREGGEPRGWFSGERFAVRRRGFGRVMLRASITGVGQKTVGPMLVNRDEGHGIAYAGIVPDGQTLVFAEDGHVRLEGVEVTAMAWAWKGACFAGNDDSTVRPRDFVFAGPGADPARLARFAVTTPAGAFSPDFAFPHAAAPIPMPGVGLGETRFAFFTQQAHFAGTDEDGDPLPPLPRTEVGFADGSVHDSPAVRPEAARIALSWLEHEAYAVRLLIPARFRTLYPEENGALERVRDALERHRPAGVDVRVEYLEDRWILGDGALEETTDPLLGLRGGTVLWAPPVTP